jgi:hypothetical protein
MRAFTWFLVRTSCCVITRQKGKRGHMVTKEAGERGRERVRKSLAGAKVTFITTYLCDYYYLVLSWELSHSFERMASSLHQAKSPWAKYPIQVPPTFNAITLGIGLQHEFWRIQTILKAQHTFKIFSWFKQTASPELGNIRPQSIQCSTRVRWQW